MLEFPQAIYKGNSVDIELTIQNGDEDYEFQVGDIVQIGVKYFIGASDYILKKEKEITQVDTETQIHISPEETNSIPTGITAILEVKLQYNGGDDCKTVYQENIELKGVVNDE